MDAPKYIEGGFIRPGLVLAWLSADECIVSTEDALARRWKCSRPGHPTATSDCAKDA